MNRLARILFVLAAAGSVAAALTHVWAIFAGPAAYASLGAPPDVVASAQAGTWYAPTITSGIAIIIFGWALYALSAAQVLPRLFLLRTGLIAIAAVLLLRGFALIPAILLVPDLLTAFDYWSSIICLGLGALFAAAIILGWRSLGKRL